MENNLVTTQPRMGLMPLNQIKESFLKGLALRPEELMQLTPELIMGVDEKGLDVLFYTHEERKAIELAIYQFSQCKNENLSAVAQSWINEFSERKIKFWEVIKRIRLAKDEKSFGNTEFAIFMNVNLSDYKDFYRHK